MEPRAATPQRRLDTIAALAGAEIPDRRAVGAGDPGGQQARKCMEDILAAAKDAGAATARHYHDTFRACRLD